MLSGIGCVAALLLLQPRKKTSTEESSLVVDDDYDCDGATNPRGHIISRDIYQFVSSLSYRCHKFIISHTEKHP